LDTTILEHKKTLLMAGDSVTESGRDRAIGIGADSLGYGYVSCLAQLLIKHNKENEITLINMGISGNTIKDLRSRWKNDVLDLNPDWISIMIGINDVWRQFDSPGLSSISTLDEYEKCLNNLILLTSNSVEKIILMTPFLVEPNYSDPMRMMVNGYVKVVRQLAVTNGLVLVDTQNKFDLAMAKIKPEELAEDRIHPTIVGHNLIAEAFMESLFDDYQQPSVLNG
jgi:lysophospholipase L1-like esterase